MTRAIVAIVMGIAALWTLQGIRRELHGINYQMTLANCVALMRTGVECEAMDRRRGGELEKDGGL